VLRSTRKARLIFAVLALFAVTVGLVPAYAPLSGGLHLVDAKAPPAPNSTSVTNNVTVGSNGISLGSVLEANGQVSANAKPLPNASVVLHMGNVKIASVQTDQNGRYAFSVPVGAYYFPAALLNGATVYTVVEPHDSSFVDTPSAATSVPVNLAPLYAIIALITAAVVIVCYLFVRRFRGKGSPAAAIVYPLDTERGSPAAAIVYPLDPAGALRVIKQKQTVTPSTQAHTPSTQAQTPVMASETKAEEAPQIEGVHPIAGEATEEQAPAVSESEPAVLEDAGDVTPLKQARELLEQGNDRQAIAALYDAALALLASRAGVTLAPHMTHWEHYAVIEAAIPEVREPLRTLTIAFERTHYGGKSLTDEQRATAVAAFESISAFDAGAEPST
jgi:hypothetical protein